MDFNSLSMIVLIDESMSFVRFIPVFFFFMIDDSVWSLYHAIFTSGSKCLSGCNCKNVHDKFLIQKSEVEIQLSGGYIFGIRNKIRSRENRDG
jgi:hypothetical protein